MISFSSPALTPRAGEYVADCVARGWVSQGRYVERLEERWADMCGASHAVACSSGTAALHLALDTLGVRRFDVVVLPAITYVATANAARYCGALLRFADVEPDSWCMDPRDASRLADEARRWSTRSPILMPVHLYDAVAEVAMLHDEGEVMVEDAAHAPGAETPLGRAGTLGAAGAFSLHASKVVACGEGGMVVTDHAELARDMRAARSQYDMNLQGRGMPGCYRHSAVGFNYRMTDLQAAVALAQLEALPRLRQRRREVISRYRLALAGEVALQGGRRASGWAMAVLLPIRCQRRPVMERLLEAGVETRAFFDPLPSLRPYQDDVPPCAAEVARRGLLLPTHPDMADRDVDEVCDRLVAEIRRQR